MTQDEMKQKVAEAALAHVEAGSIVGVGTGSTANKFIDALAGMKGDILGAVASSNATAERLAHPIHDFGGYRPPRTYPAAAGRRSARDRA